MIRNMLTVSVAGAAMLMAAPALAHPGGGGGGGPHGGGGAAGAAGAEGGMGRGGSGMSAIGNLGSFGNAPVMRGDEGSFGSRMSAPSSTSGTRDFDADDSGSRSSQGNQNSQGNQMNRGGDEDNNSQGFNHASREGIEHANQNSILARNAVPSALLPGLTTGQQILNGNGSMLGTITNVLTTRNGSIAGVVVTEPNGQMIRLPGSALSQTANGLSVNTSAFERGTVPSALLPGLTTGLTASSSTGGLLGTVTSVQTGRNGAVESVTVTAANGQTYRIPANALSISGNTVNVNAAEAFERGGVPAALLPGLGTGLTVNTAAGTAFGTVSQVITSRTGNVAAVVVTTPTGQTYQIPASSLSISGNVVSVANTGEAFEGTGVPSAFLPGLTSGLAINTSAGASLGTVSQVNTAANGTISSVVVTGANGQMFTVPASDLSISGNTVMVSGLGI